MKVLDVCCGSKMFYFDKEDDRVHFCDKRAESHILSDGRTLEINPDTVCDFTSLPFSDASFSLVVFDPPHLINVGKNSWMFKKYGRLPRDWEQEITLGFEECFRVLKVSGVLIFKWSSVQITVSQILKCTPEKPLFGHKSGKQQKTHWMTFMKGEV